MPEARLEDFGSGLAPVTEGWFVVNVRDAEGWFSERRGAACNFENEERRPLGRERGDLRLETGLRELRAVTTSAAAVLGSPPLGVAVDPQSLSMIVVF